MSMSFMLQPSSTDIRFRHTFFSYDRQHVNNPVSVWTGKHQQNKLGPQALAYHHNLSYVKHNNSIWKLYQMQKMPFAVKNRSRLSSDMIRQTQIVPFGISIIALIKSLAQIDFVIRIKSPTLGRVITVPYEHDSKYRKHHVLSKIVKEKF